MADSDKTLEILIKLGVIGREDAAAVKDLLGEMNQQAAFTNEHGQHRHDDTAGHFDWSERGV